MRRIRFSSSRYCDCGALSTVWFEENNVDDALITGRGAETRLVDIEGPFRLNELRQIVCLECGVGAEEHPTLQ